MYLELKKFAPARPLQELLRFYYCISFVGSSGQQIELENHPQGAMDLLFSLGQAVEMRAHEGTPLQLKEMFAVGQQEGFFSFYFQPGVSMWGLVFEAEGFYKLFRKSMAEMSNQGLETPGLLGKEGDFLGERLAECREDLSRVKLMDEFLLHQLAGAHPKRDFMDEALFQIRASGGSLRLSSLAEDLQISLRTLQRKFKDRVGISPKSFARIVRFNRIIRSIPNQESPDWYDLVFQGGYYDQMHFIKEFKQYTGKTPENYLQVNRQLQQFFSHPL